jgi:hypothetical protein
VTTGMTGLRFAISSNGNEGSTLNRRQDGNYHSIVHQQMMITNEQKEIFRDQGYLVVPDVVPVALCQRVIEAILEYTGVDPEKRDTWYQDNYTGHGIIPMHHHQALWDIRQHPPVHKVFSELYDDEKLWVSMDRASYKPPAQEETSGWEQAPVHWDCDPWRPVQFSLQGLVYLTDTREDQGAFSCVPLIFKNLESWCEAHLKDTDRRHPLVSDNELIAVGGKAGSLLVFNRLMPHTGRLNKSSSHRFVQYVTMQPVSDEQQRLQRVADWRDKMPPEWAINQKIPEQEIPEPGESALLTELGKKLVGVATWN